jgi:hypothetical protein
MMRAVAIICMLVAAAANFIAVQHPYQDAAKAVLTLSLKGGGMSLAAAGGLADRLVRSPQTSGGKNYVGQVLVPQILNAAAAA